MADISDVRRKVRRALGDEGGKFRTTLPGGESEYELGYMRVAGLTLDILTGSTATEIPAADYTLNATDGIVTLDTPVPSGSQLMASGTSYSLFEDADIDDFIGIAVRRHTYERSITVRYRDTDGFIKYQDTPLTLTNLPVIEEEALEIMATIEALWDLATDAASDVDVWTAEGTHLPRGQRYAQLVQQIGLLKARYDEMCAQLNVGLGRIEMSTLRRVSKTTGRYVPVFKEREYDESGPDSYPKRLLPPIDAPDLDPSGLPSPIWGPW